MVTKIVVHFGQGGRNTVTVRPNKGVRGVLFNGPLGVLAKLEKGKPEQLDGRVEAKVKGEATQLSQIHEAIGACYIVENGPAEVVICW